MTIQVPLKLVDIFFILEIPDTFENNEITEATFSTFSLTVFNLVWIIWLEKRTRDSRELLTKSFGKIITVLTIIIVISPVKYSYKKSIQIDEHC